MDTPTARERKALQNIEFDEWEYDAKLYPGEVGQGTIVKMLEKAWLERLPDLPSGQKRVRISELGKKALSTPVAAKASKRPVLRTLAPKVRPMSPKIKSR